MGSKPWLADPDVTLYHLRLTLRDQIQRVEVELAQIEDALAQKKRAQT